MSILDRYKVRRTVGFMFNGYWCIGRDQDGLYLAVKHQPTHWMPLPPLPEAAQ